MISAAPTPTVIPSVAPSIPVASNIPVLLWPCAGILLGCAFGPTRHDAWPIIVGIGSCALLLGIVTRIPTVWVIAITVLAFGLGLWRAAPQAPRAIVWPEVPVNAVRGVVRDWPVQHGEMVQTTIDATSARTDRGWEAARATFRATLPSYPPLQRGADIVIGGSPTIRAGWWRDVDGTLYGHWTRATLPDQEMTAGDLRHVLVERLIAGITTFIRPPESGLTAGMLLGEKTVLDDQTREALTATGTTQHVVISGWNIAIVVGFMGVIGRRLRSRNRLLWFAASLAAIALYAFAVGADPTVVRAAIMGAGGLIAPLLGRRADPLVWLALASAGIALINPVVVASLSFLLSCAATFGVIVIAPWLAARFARLPFTHHVPWLTEAVAVTLGASLMTEPLILHAFGRISLISPLVNIVVEPLVPIIMALGFVTALLSILPVAFPASVVGLCAAMPAWLFLTIIRWAGSFPVAASQIPQPGLLVTIALYGVVLLVTAPISVISVIGANVRDQIIGLRGTNGTIYAATFLVTLVIAISMIRFFG